MSRSFFCEDIPDIHVCFLSVYLSLVLFSLEAGSLEMLSFNAENTDMSIVQIFSYAVNVFSSLHLLFVATSTSVDYIRAVLREEVKET